MKFYYRFLEILTYSSLLYIFFDKITSHLVPRNKTIVAANRFIEKCLAQLRISFFTFQMYTLESLFYSYCSIYSLNCRMFNYKQQSNFPISIPMFRTFITYVQRVFWQTQQNCIKYKTQTALNLHAMVAKFPQL